MANSSAKNILTLLSGTASAQVVAIVISIFTARMFTPETFGEFGIYSSVAGIVVVAASLRYDMTIMLPDTDAEAKNIARLATRSNIIVSIISVVLAFALHDVILKIWGSKILADWMPLIGITVFCSAQAFIFQYWFNRHKHYKVIALNRFEQTVGSSGGQLLFGLIGMRSFLGLTFGTFFGLIWAYLKLRFKTHDLREPVPPGTPTMRELAGRYKKMPLLNLPTALIDTVRANGIQLIIGGIALGSLGQFNLAWRVLQAPIALINSALSQVFFQQLSRVKPGEMYPAVKAILKKSALLGVPPFVLLYILSPWLIPFVFGSQWHMAGDIARALTPWLAINLISAPVSTVFVVTSRQQWTLLFSVVFAAAPLAWLFFSPLEFLQTLTVLATMMAAMLVFFIGMAVMAARGYDSLRREADDEI
ncbi:MAG: oligosaccharide flippase family protein [Varibaculum sp.]|nr:oligosaccharide flippase family protein [Varibaculum sp.]